MEDWPFGLEEIEPYYDEVEYEVGVSGQAGNVGGTIDPCGNIFEGARARAYPMPALTGTEFTEHNGSDAFNWCGGRCVRHRTTIHRRGARPTPTPFFGILFLLNDPFPDAAIFFAPGLADTGEALALG